MRAHTRHLHLVVNTHWHSDHVGGNALLQAGGRRHRRQHPDADAVARRDPGCCLAEYLDQPVAPYTVDEPLDDGQVLRLGDTDWQVVRTPGHTPGHLALWQPDERLLAVGDALSDYDVGWVNLALDGPDAAAHRPGLAAPPRRPRPARGAARTRTDPGRPQAAFAAALRRAQRLVDDPDGAVWYGARRIFAFALMIRGGIPHTTVADYLVGRAWLVDAAAQLRRNTDNLAEELVSEMLTSGAILLDEGLMKAASEHSPVTPATLQVPFPSEWA